MSTDWFRPRDRTTRTRLVMAGAFLGALLLLVTSMLFSWPAATGGGVVTPEELAQEALDSPAGSCLTWTQPTGAEMRRVDCAEPHLFEVTSNVDISAEYPEDDAPPDMPSWQQIATAKCTPGAKAYLGNDIDPFGRFTIGTLKPSDEQWRDGDRKLRCGLQRAAPSGKLVASVGSASKADQSNVHEPGTCLGLDGQRIGDPVPCVDAHAYEIVGNVDLASTFPGEYPAEEVQTEKLIDLCAPVTAAYTGGADLSAKGLIPYPDTLKPESWAAGSRKVDCRVGAKLPDGSGLAPVTGSVRAETPSTTASAPVDPSAPVSTTASAPPSSTGG